MTWAGTLAVAALTAAALAPPARASFTAPVQLATGNYAVNAVTDTDAAGTMTVMATGTSSGTVLFERPRGGAWPAATRLPGRPAGVAGPVLDAAGNGALGIAWRVDSPRKYTGIAVAMRDPGGIRDRSVGHNGITSAVRSAGGKVGAALSAPRAIATRRSRFFSTPAVAAANGRAALAWGLDASRGDIGVQAAIGPAGGLGSPQTVVAKRLEPGYYRSPPAIGVALDSNGSATVLYEEPAESANGPVMTRLMAADGS